MSHWVLTSDWSEYNLRKNKYEERFYFSGEESWEVDFLVNKILNYNTNLAEEQIRHAIRYCSRKIKVPRPRAVFVIEVLKKAGALNKIYQ